MRFALTGSHGVGKTTLLQSLQDYLEFKDIKCLFNVSSARKIKKAGMSINEEGDNYDLVQMIVESSHVAVFCEDNWFADRSVIDGYAYTEYLYNQNKVSHNVYDAILTQVNNFLPLYQEVFYIPIEFDIENDGVRQTDKEFQKSIDEIILDKIKEIRGNNYVTVTGSVEERTKKIKNLLDFYLKNDVTSSHESIHSRQRSCSGC
jgi:predicted ATPase